MSSKYAKNSRIIQNDFFVVGSGEHGRNPDQWLNKKLGQFFGQLWLSFYVKHFQYDVTGEFWNFRSLQFTSGLPAFEFTDHLSMIRRFNKPLINTPFSSSLTFEGAIEQ